MTKLVKGFQTLGARGTATPLFGQFWLKSNKRAQNSALLVASILLNTYTEFYQNRIKIGQVMRKIQYAHIWAYITNIIDFGP